MNEIRTTSELTRAVATVMASVTRLQKADSNAFAKYKFTSVDDFKDHVRPLLASNNLTVRTDEVEFETIEIVADSGKKHMAARYKFTFQLCHSSGESDPLEHFTVMLPYTGPQTSGAARSYALKEWIKSKFLASSGDTDEEADTQEQRGYSKTLTKAKAREEYEGLQKSMRNVIELRDDKALMKWGEDNATDISLQPVDWQKELRREFLEALKSLKANTEIDKGNGKDAGPVF